MINSVGNCADSPYYNLGKGIHGKYYYTAG